MQRYEILGDFIKQWTQLFSFILENVLINWIVTIEIKFQISICSSYEAGMAQVISSDNKIFRSYILPDGEENNNITFIIPFVGAGWSALKLKTTLNIY